MAKLTPRHTVVTYNIAISEEERLALIAALRYRSTYVDKSRNMAYGIETAGLLQALTGVDN